MFSRLVRRTHMYLALFLAPWMLMYALSTMAMNHREFVRHRYGPPVVFHKEAERTLNASLPAGAAPREKARQILRELGMDNGLFTVNAGGGGDRLTILRQDPVAPRRITYTAAGNRLMIEKQEFRAPAFLERLHRRRGYQAGLPLENSWAFSVDLVIVAILFWAGSGLWMWWEMKRTRLAGALVAVSGLLIFGFFLFTI
jgi:hypothetical protein